jgi:hypothetical protein
VLLRAIVWLSKQLRLRLREELLLRAEQLLQQLLLELWLRPLLPLGQPLRHVQVP